MLVTGHAILTVETTCDHLELLEVGKGAPLRRDSTGELVGVVAVVFATGELVGVVAKSEHLD